MQYDYGHRGCSSAGEHLVRNEGATGSIPVTSIFPVIYSFRNEKLSNLTEGPVKAAIHLQIRFRIYCARLSKVNAGLIMI